MFTKEWKETVTATVFRIISVVKNLGGHRACYSSEIIFSNKIRSSQRYNQVKSRKPSEDATVKRLVATMS